MKYYFLGLVLALALTAQFALGAETIVMPGTTANPSAANHMYLQTSDNHLVPAEVCYSSDGNGNLVPISSGGGGGGVSPSNPGASMYNNAAVGTSAVLITAPAHTIGFLLEAESGNTDNIRWAMGATASASVGSIAEPGRDTGFMPASGNISVIAISGTQAVSVQWILSQ